MRTLLVDADGRRHASRRSRPRRAGRPSIVDLAPAAGWDEREAHDLYGVGFAGHEPLRPLVDHDLDLARWTVPVRGHDPYQVAVGPDPRRRDRVRPLPLPRRRRPDPPPRRAALLQAPRARAGRRGRHARRGARATPPAPAPPARSPTPSPTRTPARRRSGSSRPPSSPASARSCSSSSEPGATSTTSPRSAPASASPPATAHFAALTERARRLNAELTGHRFLFGSVARRRQRRSTLGRGDGPGGPRGARRDPRARLDERLARAALQRLVPGPAARTSAIVTRGGRGRCSARSGRPRGQAGAPEDVAHDLAAARLRRLRAVVPGAADGDVRARLEQRALELDQSFDLLERLLDRPVEPVGRRAGPARERRSGRPRREPARRDELRRRAGGRPGRAAAPAHRLLRELALRRARRGRQPAPRLPPDQQELRALLRLRRPLMLTLLRDLRRLRHELALPAPGRGRSLAIRHVDAGSCNGCEHELTLTSSPYYDLERFGLGIVASPRHADVLLVTGRVTTRMREPLLDRLRGDARAAPRRRARRLRARLRPARHRREPRRPARGPAPGRPPHPRLPADAGRDRARRCSS